MDNFKKYLLAIPIKSKKSQAITQEFSNILTKSKRSPIKLELDRGAEWYNIIFQNFIKNKKNQYFSIFTDKSPSITEWYNIIFQIFIKNKKKSILFNIHRQRSLNY